MLPLLEGSDRFMPAACGLSTRRTVLIQHPSLRDPRSLVKMTKRWSRESLVAEDMPSTCNLSVMAEGLGSILIEIVAKSGTLWRVS